MVRFDREKEAGMAVDRLYDETYRPQFHFTAKQNWLNDPNGLVYYKGEYHLFYQYSANMTGAVPRYWVHAVSPDMVHWTQLGDAILPDELGIIFSGSAVVDWHNTAGFQTGDERVIVGIYTSAGDPYTQSIACSNDCGRTFTKYEKNPVLGHIIGGNRDPKVIWHTPTEEWVMALYLEGHDYALFGSTNLKEWTRLCDVAMPGTEECPDFFELPVDGDPQDTRWVFWGGNGNYYLGTFDGTVFKPEVGPIASHCGGNSYAAQTWSDIPDDDGRRLQIAWMIHGQYPDMPFNQQMTFPVELTLRRTPAGPRLCSRPVKEIAGLHKKKHAWADTVVTPGENLLADLSGDLFEIRAEIEPAGATQVGFILRGEDVTYDAAAATISCLGHTAPLPAEGGRIKLHILLDRASIEVFGNDGLISMPTCFLPDPASTSLGIYTVGGDANLVTLEVYELESAWPRRVARPGGG